MWRAHALAVAAVLACPAFAAAQAHPVVLVHGIASSAGTWDETSRRLTEDFDISVFRTSTDSFATFESQAQQVNSNFGFLSGSTVAIGHSNGGLVSRVWSASHPMTGLITLAAPNSGAPLAANMFHVGWFVSEAVQSLLDALDQSQQCAWGWCTGGTGSPYAQIFSSIVDDTLNLHDLLWDAWYTLVLDLLPDSDVLGEMVPGSSFLQDLNSSGQLGVETRNVGSRIGIVSEAHNYFDAGLFRAIWPDSGDAISNVQHGLADYLRGRAFEIWAFEDPNDSQLQDLAWALYLAGLRLDDLDWNWCVNVSRPSYDRNFGRVCDANDTIVPYWSQYLPWSTANLWIGDGPAHTQEASDGRSYDALSQVLDEYVHLPRSGGSSDDGDGGESMEANSAIRGCSNYVEWSPVFQSTAADCRAYCERQNADTCEWHVSGSCYVEFGNGCYVQGGFSGWYAAVLR
jgi:pimeloyl-ACP methyl ester carboxylesterase